MLAEMPKNSGKLRNSSPSHDGRATTPTLASLGITYNDSSRWQKLAAIDDEESGRKSSTYNRYHDGTGCPNPLRPRHHQDDRNQSNGGESYAREIALHNAEGNHKHGMHQSMHFKAFVGHQSLLARKMQTLHRAMPTASSHGGALGGVSADGGAMVLPRGRSFAVARFCEPQGRCWRCQRKGCRETGKSKCNVAL